MRSPFNRQNNAKNARKIDSQNCQRCGEPDMYCSCTASHTPTPWKVEKDDEVYITDPIGRVVLNQVPAFNGRTAEDHAAFIVRAVNGHEVLLSELISLVAWIEEESERAESFERQLNNAKATIAKAEGK